MYENNSYKARCLFCPMDEDREVELFAEERRKELRKQALKKKKEEEWEKELHKRENSAYYDPKTNSFLIFERGPRDGGIAHRYVVRIPGKPTVRRATARHVLPEVYRNREGLSSCPLGLDSELKGLELCSDARVKVQKYFIKCVDWARKSEKRAAECKPVLDQVIDWLYHAGKKELDLYSKQKDL